jgi:hypothetical protein
MKATWRNGRIVLDDPVDWPEGRRLVVTEAPPIDPVAFNRAFQQAVKPYLWTLCVCASLALISAQIAQLTMPRISQTTIFGLPLLWMNPDGINVAIVAIGGCPTIGLLAVGGLAVGVFALGGGAIGVIAVGGGAFGLVALGGGAVGFIALGGGAVGVIAIGGSAGGLYAWGREGWSKGRYVLDVHRQDAPAVRFFCHYFPVLRQAFEPPLQEETASETK